MASSSSLSFNFLRGRDTVSPHMSKVASNAQRMAAKLKASSSVMGLAIGAVVAIVAGGIGQLVAFTDAIWPMVGALAALPAMAVAAAFGIATLLVGFKGLGAAMKKSAGGGADLAAQERRVAMAQRAAAAAQDDLNDARRTAAELIADTVRSLARARLDEEGAVLAVADAQRELREARGSGDASAVRHARLGYREAVQSLEEVRARLADVTEEEAKRSAAGVEGSDEVTAALERQRDAEYELAQARKGSAGGANAAASAYAKLTAEGKALVDVLRAQGPAWGKVRVAVQSGMLAGVAGDFKALSTAYLPVMRTHLVGIAVGWNNAFRGTAQTMAAAGFVSDMNTSLGRIATMWQRVGQAFAPFWSGFRHFVVVGSEFMPRLGSWTLSLAQRFDKWAKSARDTGKAHDWIEKALKVGHDFNRLLFALGGATGALFAAGDPGEGYLANLTRGAEAMRDFWRTPEGHDRLAGFFTQLREIWSEAWIAFKLLMDVLTQADLSGVVGAFTILGAVFAFLAQHMGVVNAVLPVLIPAFVAYKVVAMTAYVATSLWVVAAKAAWVAGRLWHATLVVGKGIMMAYRAVVWTTSGALFRLKTSLVASKVAMVAAATWTKVVTVAQWLWNASWYGFPLVWIIAAIIAVVAIIVILWMKSAGFRNFFIGVWGHIWSFLKMVGAWFAGPFKDFFVNAFNWVITKAQEMHAFIVNKITAIVLFVTSVKDRITAAAKGMWDGLVAAFRGAINFLLSLWNRVDFAINIRVPDWVPGIGGKGFSVPDILPDLPYLHSGGTITRGGAAVVGDDAFGRGGEVVSLPRGAQVAPLSAGAGGVMTHRIELAGPEEMRKLIRRIVSDFGGGDVQVAFGRS